MNEKSIKELMLICDIETDESKVGWRKRRDAMEKWVDKYVESVSTDLRVVNPEHFNTESMDFIRENLAKNLAEDLTTYTRYDIENTKISAKMLVINLNKENKQ